MRAILFSEIMLRTLISRQPPWGRTMYSVKCMQLENSGSVVKMPRHLLKKIVWAFQRTRVRLLAPKTACTMWSGMHYSWYVVGHALRTIFCACTTNDPVICCKNCWLRWNAEKILYQKPVRTYRTEKIWPRARARSEAHLGYCLGYYSSCNQSGYH